LIPTRRLVALAAAPIALAIAVPFVPGVWIPLVAIDIALAVIALLDALIAWGNVGVARKFAPVQAIGRPFEVTLTVQNLGRRRLSLRVADDAPGPTEGLPAAIVLPGGTHGEVTYTMRVDKRGAHPFGAVAVRWKSPLGLWERQRRLDTPGSLRVYPDFAQLRSYGLQARADEQRLPVRVRRRPGGENEFERLRPYVPGDPYRHIDWRATARRGDFVSREYGQEVNQNLIFLLDAGRMMSAANGSLTSFDHALNAALMMAQVALRHGDRVGFLAFDHQVRAWLPPRGGTRSGGRLIRATYDLFPSLAEPDYAMAFRHLSKRVRRRSLVVLLTAVVDEPNAALSSALVRGLAGRHLPLCVWVRDGELTALAEGPADNRSDAYVRAAAAEIVGWREKALANVRRSGALVVDSPPERLTPQLLSRYLEIKARRML
jgi:uncharacterized protein (DUF58 family)